MRIIRHLLLTAVAFMVTHAAHGQEEDPANAHTYWMQLLPHVQATQADDDSIIEPLISGDDFDILMAYLEEPVRPMTPQEQAILQAAQPALALVRQAANAEYYDAQLDYDQGFYMLVPHLGVLRRGSCLLAAEARAAAASGDIQAATDSLGLLGVISTQAVADATTISSLVSAVTYRVHDNELEQFLGAGHLDREGAQLLLERMEGLALEDPFNFGGAIHTERDGMLGFFDDLIDLDAEGRVELLADFATFDNDEPPEGYDTQRIIEERAIASDLLEQLVEGFNDPDRQRGRALVQDVTAQVDLLAAEGHLLIGMMMPSIDRILDLRDEFEEQVDNRLRQLEGVASGRIEPSALMNAAVIWLPAGRAAASLPAEDQAAVAVVIGLDPEACLPLPGTGLASDLQDAPEIPAPADALEIVSGVMDSKASRILVAGLDAASIARADFSVSGTERPFIQPRYLGELRSVGRLLLASAAVRRAAWVRSESPAATPEVVEIARVEALLAAEEVAAVLTLTRHLLKDPAIAHSILGATLFDEAADQVEAFIVTIKRREAAGIDDPRIDRAILQRLRSAMASVPRNDAFALKAALDADRAHLLDHLARASRSSLDAECVQILARHLANRDADQVLVILAGDAGRGPLDSIQREGRFLVDDAMHARIEERLNEYQALPPTPPLARMDDVIPLAPSLRGDGPLRLIAIKDLTAAIADDDTHAFYSALRRLNLAPLVDVRGAARRGYGRIGDVEQALSWPSREPTAEAP